MISNANLVNNVRSEMHSTSIRGLEEYNRMEFRAESPEHMVFLFETSALPIDSVSEMKGHSVPFGIQCKTHSNFAGTCLNGFCVFGCAMFMVQFGALFL